ncbi:hypothetical protein [Chryseobacterium sp. JK1]|uniref:hypothetical protein n=1 Tax=Chryseobacterium sp. JK1 TaxID=874294 RepID=UPI003D69B985
MKDKILYILFIFPVLIPSQTKRSPEKEWYNYQMGKCQKQNQKDKAEYMRLKKEASEMDFYELTRAIINDLDKTQFTRKYINFCYQFSQLLCDTVDPEEYNCIKKYNIKDSFYSRKSWTAGDLKYLGSIFDDKIIIPSKKSTGFGYKEGFYYTDEETSSIFNSFKKGKKGGSEREFFYYSKKDKTPLVISSEEVMDTLFFDFKNVLGYQVEVSQYINGKKSVKIFEYHNGEWVKNE